MSRPASTAIDIEPVAVALEQIEVGASVVFTGIDLETGLRVRVHVERPAFANRAVSIRALKARGLVLTLNVQPIAFDG